MSIYINEKIFDAFPEFKSDRLIFREFNEDDAENLFRIRSQEAVMRYMDSYPEPTVKAIKNRIHEMQLQFQLKIGLNWVIVEKAIDKMIGYFGIWKIDKENCRGEIGYALNHDYWGQGYMLEAFQTLIPFGFHQMNLHSFEANVNPKNQNSKQLLEKVGFKQEAYFRENFLFAGKFLDTVTYSLLERDYKF
ncbi:MAG: GNAT family N-acetyltransferase [Fidelibacterota bacterium]